MSMPHSNTSASSTWVSSWLDSELSTASCLWKINKISWRKPPFPDLANTLSNGYYLLFLSPWFQQPYFWTRSGKILIWKTKRRLSYYGFCRVVGSFFPLLSWSRWPPESAIASGWKDTCTTIQKKGMKRNKTCGQFQRSDVRAVKGGRRSTRMIRYKFLHDFILCRLWINPLSCMIS